MTTVEKKQEDIETEVEEVETTEKPIEEMSAEEIKAKAEEIENEIKELKKSKEGDDYKQNQLIRLTKAQEKLKNLKETVPVVEEKPVQDVLDTDDLVTLRLNNISKDSEKAEILARYKKAGIIDNYESGLSHVAVVAEFEALDAKEAAQTVIDENDKNSEGYLKSTREIISSYKTTGEVPEDPKAQEVIVEDNLKQMGL